MASEALRLPASASQHFGAEVEDQFGRLLPAEVLDHFRQVAQCEQVAFEPEEVGFDGTFIKKRQDLSSMAEVESGEEAPLNAPRLALTGEHSYPSIDVVPLYRLGQRHNLKPVGSTTCHREGGRGKNHQPVGALIS